MNNNTLSESVLLCEKQIERTIDGPRFGNSPVQSTNIVKRQLIWSSHKPDDWEILVYKQTEGWEVCFFRWPIHHEHAIGSSFESVRQRAEQRIRVLEAGHLQKTEWPHRSVGATSPDQISPQSHPREWVRYEPRTAVRTPFAKSLRQSAEVENRR